MRHISSALLLGVVCAVALLMLMPMRLSAQKDAAEQAILKVIADRQTAWNAGDEQGYARLLTEDADIASSSGRIARGREAVVQLYREQRVGVFAGATTSTRVVQIRLINPDVALVDVDRELTGLRTTAVAPRSRTVFVFVKQRDGRWLIAAQRAGPQNQP